MLFLLATPEYNNIQSNTTKVRVHLRNGVAEIFDQHQDLMGKIDNNILEVETNFENKIDRELKKVFSQAESSNFPSYISSFDNVYAK